jgi:hypothetical protein
MDQERFNGCQMSQLVFEEPSHLADLRLTIPVEVEGQLDVPDSAETLVLDIYEDYNGTTVVNFGRESRLEAFEATGEHKGTTQVFLRFTERFLKRCRDFQEFHQKRYLHKGADDDADYYYGYDDDDSS